MIANRPIEILLVEDDELFRLGLRVRLERESDLKVTGEAEDGETAISLASKQHFDLVLLDLGLPGMSGLEICRQIAEDFPELPILVLTANNESSTIDRTIAAGAKGYCFKGIAPETLILAVRSVAAGASWWDTKATAAIQTTFVSRCANLQGATASSPESGKLKLLTEREREVLALIADGFNNPEIARKLYITPGTVRVHVHAILHKLGVRDRTQAAILSLGSHSRGAGD
jgi:two-component system, NarL family, response regulator